eukprot:g4131.t1
MYDFISQVRNDKALSVPESGVIDASSSDNQNGAIEGIDAVANLEEELTNGLGYRYYLAAEGPQDKFKFTFQYNPDGSGNGAAGANGSTSSLGSSSSGSTAGEAGNNASPSYISEHHMEMQNVSRQLSHHRGSSHRSRRKKSARSPPYGHDAIQNNDPYQRSGSNGSGISAGQFFGGARTFQHLHSYMNENATSGGSQKDFRGNATSNSGTSSSNALNSGDYKPNIDVLFLEREKEILRFEIEGIIDQADTEVMLSHLKRDYETYILAKHAQKLKATDSGGGSSSSFRTFGVDGGSISAASRGAFTAAASTSSHDFSTLSNTQKLSNLSTLASEVYTNAGRSGGAATGGAVGSSGSDLSGAGENNGPQVETSGDAFDKNTRQDPGAMKSILGKHTVLSLPRSKINYHLSFEDEQWLKKHPIYGENGDPRYHLEKDIFERMIWVLEISSGLSDKMVLFPEALHLFVKEFNLRTAGTIARDLTSTVYNYWRAKRERIHKPLMRQFWPQTDPDNQNPHEVFRSRKEEGQYKLRRSRRDAVKNDMDSFYRLSLLTHDFSKAMKMLYMVKKREHMKREEVDYLSEIFMQQLFDMGADMSRMQVQLDAAAANTTGSDTFSLNNKVSGSPKKKDASENQPKSDSTSENKNQNQSENVTNTTATTTTTTTNASGTVASASASASSSTSTNPATTSTNPSSTLSTLNSTSLPSSSTTSFPSERRSELLRLVDRRRLRRAQLKQRMKEIDEKALYLQKFIKQQEQAYKQQLRVYNQQRAILASKAYANAMLKRQGISSSFGGNEDVLGYSKMKDGVVEKNQYFHIPGTLLNIHAPPLKITDHALTRSAGEYDQLILEEQRRAERDGTFIDVVKHIQEAERDAQGRLNDLLAKEERNRQKIRNKRKRRQKAATNAGGATIDEYEYEYEEGKDGELEKEEKGNHHHSVRAKLENFETQLVKTSHPALTSAIVSTNGLGLGRGDNTKNQSSSQDRRHHSLLSSTSSSTSSRRGGRGAAGSYPMMGGGSNRNNSNASSKRNNHSGLALRGIGVGDYSAEAALFSFTLQRKKLSAAERSLLASTIANGISGSSNGRDAIHYLPLSQDLLTHEIRKPGRKQVLHAEATAAMIEDELHQQLNQKAANPNQKEDSGSSAGLGGLFGGASNTTGAGGKDPMILDADRRHNAKALAASLQTSNLKKWSSLYALDQKRHGTLRRPHYLPWFCRSQDEFPTYRSLLTQYCFPSQTQWKDDSENDEKNNDRVSKRLLSTNDNIGQSKNEENTNLTSALPQKRRRRNYRTRPRIGRGGRLIIDRIVSRKSTRKTNGNSTAKIINPSNLGLGIEQSQKSLAEIAGEIVMASQGLNPQANDPIKVACDGSSDDKNQNEKDANGSNRSSFTTTTASVLTTRDTNPNVERQVTGALASGKESVRSTNALCEMFLGSNFLNKNQLVKGVMTSGGRLVFPSEATTNPNISSELINAMASIEPCRVASSKLQGIFSMADDIGGEPFLENRGADFLLQPSSKERWSTTQYALRETQKIMQRRNEDSTTGTTNEKGKDVGTSPAVDESDIDDSALKESLHSYETQLQMVL